MGFVCHSCIKPIKRQDLSVETFQRNAEPFLAIHPIRTLNLRLASLLHANQGGLVPTLAPQVRTGCGSGVCDELRSRLRRTRPSRLLGTAPPARSARPAPPRTRGLGWAAGRRPAAGSPRPSPTAAAAVSARPGGPARPPRPPAPALPVPWSPTRAPRARAGRGQGCGAVRLSRPRTGTLARERSAPRLRPR